MAGSIPGARKSLFLDMLGGCFYGFLHMLGHVGGHFCWLGWGHFLIGSGSFFREILGGLGCVWEWSGDVFR